jgi:hypothetical protein
MKRAIAVVLSLALGFNACWMLFAPQSWYESVPGVVDSGPANHHFIRDIGCAFLVVALSLVWLALARARAWPAALAGGAFLGLHALVHVWDTVAGREHTHRLVSELPTVILPAVVVLWLALSDDRPRAQPAREPKPRAHGLFARIVRGRLAAFERDFHYDTTYIADVADASVPAFFKFGLFNAFAGHRESVPRDAFFAARIAATLAEDCGPCTQLVVDMASAEAMPAPVLRAIVAGDEDAMSADARLGYRFARAVLRRDLGAADEQRETVLSTWGPKGLVTLAFAVASSRVFPALKYALGHARACSRVRIDGTDTVPEHAKPA